MHQPSTYLPGMVRSPAAMREPTYFVLAALLAGPLHGYAIIKRAEEMSGGRVRLATGTLYTALDRLTDEGYVRLVSEEMVAGRMRRSYGLTDEGSAALGAEAQRMAEAARLVTEAKRARALPRSAGGRGQRDGERDRELPARTEQLARTKRAGEDRDPAGADRVTAFERRSRLAAACLPGAYRRERGEEMIGTLLETTPGPGLAEAAGRPRADRGWGLKARAAQNRRISAAANLRVAVMAGSSLYLVMLAAEFLGIGLGELRLNPMPAWYWPVLVGASLAATVLLAWVTRPAIAAISALAAAAAVYFLDRGPAHLLWPFMPVFVSLAVIVLLAPRQSRPPRKWLWLIGAFSVAVLWFAIDPLYGWGFQVLRVAPVVAFGVASIAWIAIDARLAVAVATFCLTLYAYQALAFDSGLLPFLLIIGGVGALAAWLLRRQSARGTTTMPSDHGPARIPIRPQRIA